MTPPPDNLGGPVFQPPQLHDTPTLVSPDGEKILMVSAHGMYMSRFADVELLWELAHRSDELKGLPTQIQFNPMKETR